MSSHNRAKALWRCCAIACILAAGTLPHQSPAQDSGSPAADGAALYVQFGCSGCHGYEAQGTVASPPVPRLAPPAYPYEAFAAFVRTPPRVMPAYSPNVLSDAQLREIFGFVESIPEPPAVDDIPVLRNLR